MGQLWNDEFTVEALTSAETLDSSLKWFASARITGVQSGHPFSAIYDFGAAFDTREQAEAYALEQGRVRARQLYDTPAAGAADD
jgi:hypothetical protein